MNNYEAAVTHCVLQGVAEKLTAEDLSQPLMKQLVIIAMNYSKVTGSKFDDVMELIHIRLDEEAVRIEGPRNGASSSH